jgi:energy-coupling factor transporter ATP-binding protein EcfA2
MNDVTCKNDVKNDSSSIFFSFLVQVDGELTLNFTKNTSTRPINYDSLSPGETIWLLNLLISYEISNFPSRRNEFQDSILLLDEPDAHLHPSFIKIFLDTITKYVNNYGVQVIMTTQNPETICLVPDVKCLFYMERDEITKKVYIKSAENKTRCMQLLTSNIIYINKAFRMIFVETSIDKIYFECINAYLIKHNFLLDIKQLIFICPSSKSLKGNITTKDSTKPFDVRKFVNIFTESYDDTTSLENFAYGIVRCRDTNEILSRNIQQLKRCGIENYILDPINIFYYIISNDLIAIQSPETEITHISEYNELATKCRQKTIHQMLYEPDGISTLQSIINLMDKLLSKNFSEREENIDVSRLFYKRRPFSFRNSLHKITQ